MKRLHVHVAVNDIEHAIGFYSTLFKAQPSVATLDYAKWMLEDPRVNFAISARGAAQPGLDHLGIQVEDAAELNESTIDCKRRTVLWKKRAPLLAVIISWRSPGLRIRAAFAGKPF